jgi:hypothetical protein
MIGIWSGWIGWWIGRNDYLMNMMTIYGVWVFILHVVSKETIPNVMEVFIKVAADAVRKTMQLHIKTSALLVRVIGKIDNHHYFGFEIIRKLP